MDIRLDGKVALVTGGSKGIGAGIAACFAEAGADLTITGYSDMEGAEETAVAIRGLGRRCETAELDVGVEAEVDVLFRQHLDAFGRIDILVANAGISPKGTPVHETTAAEFERVLRTNLYGAFFCARAAAKRMLAQGGGGRILMITSVHEEACTAGGGPYHVSKAGMRNLMRTMAVELAEHGITVNGIAPGMILTPMNGEALENPQVAADAAAVIPVRRVGLPADIAAMACFLASDAASYCTGATYYVDGGWMLTMPDV